METECTVGYISNSGLSPRNLRPVLTHIPIAPAHLHMHIEVPVGRTVYFYFFVNRKSGGLLGPVLIDMGVDEITLDGGPYRQLFPNLDKVKVKICELNEPEIRRIRMQEVNILSRTTHCSLVIIEATSIEIYVIACGGDGTVIWLIDELVANKVNFNTIAITLMPFGTGNDFAIACGFKRSPNILLSNRTGELTNKSLRNSEVVRSGLSFLRNQKDGYMGCRDRMHRTRMH